MVGYKDGRLYNGGLIFHKVASHHQEKEISEIKNEISSAHGQKTLPPLNFLCSPPRKFNWQRHDRELHICILQTSAFYMRRRGDEPPTQTTHSALMLFIYTTQTVTMVAPEPHVDKPDLTFDTDPGIIQ